MYSSCNQKFNLSFVLKYELKLKSHLHVGDGHTEEQVHDHDGDDDDEGGEDGVGREREVLGLVVVLQHADPVRVVGLGPLAVGDVHVDVVPLRVVEVVVLQLARHHDHDL